MKLDPSHYGCSTHRGGANTEKITEAVRASLTAAGTPTEVGRRGGSFVLDQSSTRLGLSLRPRASAERLPFDITVSCPGIADGKPAAPHRVRARGMYGFIADDWRETYYRRHRAWADVDDDGQG
jgi:hypothetical protein